MKIQLYKLKSAIRVGLQKITSIFLPEIRISQKFTYDLLGHEDGHYFIGYYDKDPIDHFGKYTL